MSGQPKPLRSPQSILALTNSIVNISNACTSVDEAAEQLIAYLNTIRPNVALRLSLALARDKASEVARQRYLTQPFELRWRNGSGEIVRGWDNLVKELRKLSMTYKVSSLKVLLSGKRQIAIDLVNPENDMLDVFTVRKLAQPKPKRGRPPGASAKRKVTRAERVAAIEQGPLIAGKRNKLRGLRTVLEEQEDDA